MLFCVPSVKKKSFSSYSFPLSHTPTVTPSLPILTFSHGERFLSDIAVRKRPSSGGGAGRRTPRRGGQTTREHACIIKTGQRCESKAGNLDEEPGLRRYDRSKILKKVRLLSICLFITPVTFLCCAEFTLWPESRQCRS